MTQRKDMRNVLGKVFDDLSEKLKWGPSPSEKVQEEIESACKALYDKWLLGYRTQYGDDAPMGIFAFLALPDDYVKVLDFEPGSLVKGVGTGKYYLVDRWRISHEKVVAVCVDASGGMVTLGADEFEPADIPQGVVDVVKADIARELGHRLMGHGKESNEKA